MKRVLFCLSSLSRTNGISKFIMNYYFYVLGYDIKIDFFIVHNIVDKEYEKVIKFNGSRIYVCDQWKKLNRIRYCEKEITKILKNDKYDIVHINLVDQFAYGCAKGATKSNVDKAIFHVHNPYTISKLLFFRNILFAKTIKNATDLVACSYKAGKSIFHNKRFKIINNGLNLEDYKYDEDFRIKEKKKLKVENKKIIGVVGRICEQKNPKKIIKVFKQIHKLDKNVDLMWIGTGDYEEKLKVLIKKNGIDDCVHLLGNKTDVNKYYSCFDLFYLPSKYEGLGIVFIEAQAAGLYTIMSTRVPEDSIISKLAVRYSNFVSAKKMATIIVSYLYKDVDRIESFYNLKSNSKYDIKNCYMDVINLYNK